MLQRMSDVCAYEFVNSAWDEFCWSNDRIVPHSGFKRLDNYFVLGDSHKKPRCELTNRLSNTGNISAVTFIDQGRELRSRFSSLSKRRNTMLEKDSLSHKRNGAFTSTSDSDLMNGASILASDDTMPSTHGLKSTNTDLNGSEFCGHDTILSDENTIVDDNSFNYSLSDINHTGSDLDFFGNAENKESNDFLYYGWPEIGNFEDIDGMFRSCNPTFGLGGSKEDELGWLSSADDLGGSADVLKSDVKFPCREPDVKNISKNHESLEDYSINNSAITTAPIGYKDSSWTSDNSDSYLSFVTGPAKADRKDGFVPLEQGLGFNGKNQQRISTNRHSRTGGASMKNKHKRQIKLQNQSEGKGKEQHIRNGSFNHIVDLPNEVKQLPSGLTSQHAFPSVHMQQKQHPRSPNSYNYLQNPVSYVHSDYSHNLATVNDKPSSIIFETNDFTSVSPRDSSNVSQRKKLHSCQGTQSSFTSSLKNGRVTVQASVFGPGFTGNFENHKDPEEVTFTTPAELGASNEQECSTISSGLDDISLEAANFSQLQLVMQRLDLRMKLCIRDSLYRLARSAERRHNHANMNMGCGNGRDAASGASIAEETNKYTSFMDMETDTNPIDRSIAHLLFYRPSNSPTRPAQNSFPFKSPRVVNGSVANPAILVENSVSEETVSEAMVVSNC